MWRDAVVVIHNSYLTSFMREIALFAAAFEDGPERIEWDSPPLASLFTAVGKKFVAEQMHAIAPSHLARIIFLESIIDYERHFRRIYALRDANRRLLTRTDLFARLASDFFMHHELGHVAEVDPRFDRFIQPAIDACLVEWAAAGEPTCPDEPLLRREARADIFALNCCFSIYGPDITDTTLRSFCTLLVQAVTALNVMYAAAHDLHRLNVDPAHQAIDIDAELSLWSDRQAIMLRYLDDFIFDKRTVVCASADKVDPIAIPDAMGILVNTEALLAPLSEDTRRVSELISFGFNENPNAFDEVIAGSRVASVLKERKRGRRAVSFTGLGKPE